MKVPTCIYCGNTEFYQGPEGGGAINVVCTNHKCRHWFNVVLTDLEDLHKTAPIDRFPINKNYETI